MSSQAALLWDESYLWGLMSVRALSALNLPFDIVTANELKVGVPDNYKLLFVPGGWASNKLKSIAGEGIRAIKDFVANGGLYVGICGGAGLATADGIGLLSIKRLPTALRVPSLSGPVIAGLRPHPIFEGIEDSRFYLWWPSQFMVSGGEASVIATYKEVTDEAFSADLSVGAVRRYGNWKDLEVQYGINLNPDRVIGEPLILEAGYKRGKVLLCLVHFDSPNDPNGQRALVNIWRYAGIEAEAHDYGADYTLPTNPNDRLFNIEKAVQRLIDFGIQNFLWFWRNEMLLGWRRGIRGLECCNLYILVKELCQLMRTCVDEPHYTLQLLDIESALIPFVEDLKRLLFLEMLELQRSKITYEWADNEEIVALRDRLFSRSKSYGGRYKSLLGLIDGLLLSLIRQRRSGLRPLGPPRA